MPYSGRSEATERKGGGSLIAVAEVARAHGIRGELRLKLYNDESTLLTRGRAVTVRFSDGQTRSQVIESARRSNKALLIELEGVNTRNEAETYHGAELLVPRDAFPKLSEGEFYACDIEGARAILASGEAIGWVRGITTYPSCEVLVIEREPGKTVEVPLVEGYVRRIDPDRGEVEIVTLEGIE